MPAPFANPIGYAQFRLMGGWRNTLGTSTAYALIVGAAMFGFVRALSQPASQTFAAFLTVFMSLQVLVLLIYGTVRVGGAVVADVNSKLIESHRLMPTMPGNAIVGYWLGAPLQAFCLFAINLVLGMVAANGAALPAQSWVASNLILLAFSLFIWTIVIFFSWRAGMASILTIGAMVGMIGGGFELLRYVPGTSVLVSPLIGHTIFDIRTGLTIDWRYAVSVGAEAFIAALYLMAAGRRYRRDEPVAFTPDLAMALLAAWVGVNLMGTLFPREFQPFSRMLGQGDAQARFVISYTSILLLAVLPVSAAVWLTNPSRHPGRGAQWLPMLTVGAASVVAIVMAVGLPTLRREHIAIIRIALCTAAFLASIRYVIGLALRLRFRTRRTIVGWLMLTWCVPLVIEAFRSATEVDDSGEQQMSQIAMCSPPAEIFQITSFSPSVHTGGYAGLATQCALAALLACAYHAARARRAA